MIDQPSFLIFRSSTRCVIYPTFPLFSCPSSHASPVIQNTLFAFILIIVLDKKNGRQNERSRRRWDDHCTRSFFGKSNVTLHFHSQGFVSASIAMKRGEEGKRSIRSSLSRDDTQGAEISFLSYINERRERGQWYTELDCTLLASLLALLINFFLPHLPWSSLMHKFA